LFIIFRKQDFIIQISKLNQEKTMLEEKVMKMKQAIMDIKSKLDFELNKKFEKKELELRDSKFQMALLEKYELNYII
jgi:formate-dependent nitrite reductase cytochrome c552 subunit